MSMHDNQAKTMQPKEDKNKVRAMLENNKKKFRATLIRPTSG